MDNFNDPCFLPPPSPQEKKNNPTKSGMPLAHNEPLNIGRSAMTRIDTTPAVSRTLIEGQGPGWTVCTRWAQSHQFLMGV